MIPDGDEGEVACLQCGRRIFPPFPVVVIEQGMDRDKCYRCKAPLKESTKCRRTCDDCVAKKAMYATERRNKANAMGLCHRCCLREPRSDLGLKTCLECANNKIKYQQNQSHKRGSAYVEI